ncbi:MAG: DUF4124 domain-containing protein [Candidatus Sedimenticola sp. (ex Thyasira tokunagai)]
MRRMAFILCGAMAFTIASAQAGSIKKWTDADGNVHFGDVPAAGTNTEEVKVKVIESNPNNSRGMLTGSSVSTSRRVSRPIHSSTQPESEGRGYADELRYRNAAAKGKVIKGMTAKEAKRAMGTPDRINRNSGSGGTREQWVYERKDGSRDYIHLNDGVVGGRN